MTERNSEIVIKGNRQFNPETQGAVWSGSAKERAQRILDAVFGGKLFQVTQELQPSRHDVYRKGKAVSIEREAERTRDIQEALDDEVERENLGQIPTTKGQPPCIRARKTHSS